MKNHAGPNDNLLPLKLFSTQSKQTIKRNQLKEAGSWPEEKNINLSTKSIILWLWLRLERMFLSYDSGLITVRYESGIHLSFNFICQIDAPYFANSVAIPMRKLRVWNSLEPENKSFVHNQFDLVGIENV